MELVGEEDTGLLSSQELTTANRLQLRDLQIEKAGKDFKNR